MREPTGALVPEVAEEDARAAHRLAVLACARPAADELLGRELCDARAPELGRDARDAASRLAVCLRGLFCVEAAASKEVWCRAPPREVKEAVLLVAAALPERSGKAGGFCVAEFQWRRGAELRLTLCFAEAGFDERGGEAALAGAFHAAFGDLGVTSGAFRAAMKRAPVVPVTLADFGLPQLLSCAAFVLRAPERSLDFYEALASTWPAERRLARLADAESPSAAELRELWGAMRWRGTGPYGAPLLLVQPTEAEVRAAVGSRAALASRRFFVLLLLRQRWRLFVARPAAKEEGSWAFRSVGAAGAAPRLLTVVGLRPLRVPEPCAALAAAPAGRSGRAALLFCAKGSVPKDEEAQRRAFLDALR